jgi:hypothetical protein
MHFLFVFSFSLCEQANNQADESRLIIKTTRFHWHTSKEVQVPHLSTHRRLSDQRDVVTDAFVRGPLEM